MVSRRLHVSALAALLAALPLVAGCGRAADGDGPDGAGVAPVVDRVVEAACGQCRFDLAGEGCALAVRFDGTARFVDGTSIDEHGDAHADDGFCNAVREARVAGSVVGERFVVEAFELLPAGGG